MRLFREEQRTARVRGAVFAIAFALSVLATAFFQAQVADGERYRTRAEENRLRPVAVPAPRGTILDRNGEVVATSVVTYAVSVLPGDSSVVAATLRDLAPLLGLSGDAVAELLRRRGRRPHDLLEVTPAATFAQVAAVEERRAAFPNLLVVERPRRHYPAGAAVGHLVGYVGEVSPGELDRADFAAAGYRQGRLVGKAGVERQYELRLGGRDGARFVEVDAMGRVVDSRSPAGALAPRPGRPLTLTLDLALQRYVHSIFPDSMRGAVVALVPSTGEVLALYSHPTYDPNDLVGRIPPRLWAQLSRDPARPLLDRAINALYPPASTWKTATAAAGIARGLVREGSRMPYPCTGGFTFAGRYARCHERAVHGAVDLAGALEKSCNVWFYQLGIRLGLAELTRAGTRMGFTGRTGIDLPGERGTVFPTGPQWYRERFNYVAPSDVMSLSIGQGPNSQSVLSMALFYSAVAGDGTAAAPRLVRAEGGGERRPMVDLGLTPGQLQVLWGGLARVTEPGGTGRHVSLERWRVLGKTGTAQNSQGADHGWFIGFAGAPGSHPEIVVAALVEHGLHGGDVAPIAAKAMDFYLRRKHGLPPDPRPTLLDRWESGRVPWNRYDSYPAPLVPAPRHSTEPPVRSAGVRTAAAATPRRMP